MILELTNNTNSYSFEVEDLNYGEKLYYKFQIPTNDIADGKYDMVLIDGDEIIAKEQLCIGDFNTETIQYKRAENVYINAPLDANIEEEVVATIDSIDSIIFPTGEFDAMKKAVVNAQPVYDNGYNQGSTDGYDNGYNAGDIDGYNRGYNEGETDQKTKLTGITITENGTYSREDGYNEVIVDVPDLNGDYNEGYDAGKVDGYDSGYTAGETEQKLKLTNITITKNGTYTREDGYNSVVVNVEDTNGSYDEGYQAGIEYASENAGEIVAANAIDLVVTEFRTYYTKYSDNIPNNNPIILDNLIKSVDVQPKLNVVEMGLKFGYSSLEEIPEVFDFDGITNMNFMFYNCTKLQTIPEIDTSNVTNMSQAFSYCSSLTSMPKLNTTNVTDMSNMFSYCNKLQTIPEIDTSNVRNMQQMFRDCSSLISIPALQAGKLDMPESYQGFIGYNELPNVTEFGGFIGLKKQLIGTYNLVKLPNLNYQSCINVLNGLFDFVGAGFTPDSNQANLQVHQNFINLVGDEISIGTSKGWNIYA